MEDEAPAGGGPHAAPRDAQLIHGRSGSHTVVLFANLLVTPCCTDAISCPRHNCGREIAARASPQGCNIFCKSRHLTGFSFPN